MIFGQGGAGGGGGGQIMCFDCCLQPGAVVTCNLFKLGDLLTGFLSLPS